jgi:hypothetical protein
MPQSGLRHGYENRRKLAKHLDEAIDLLDNAIRHVKRALNRAKGERMRDR